MKNNLIAINLDKVLCGVKRIHIAEGTPLAGSPRQSVGRCPRTNDVRFVHLLLLLLFGARSSHLFIAQKSDTLFGIAFLWWEEVDSNYRSQ